MAISEIDRLIELLARLPGLGPRSARRAVLHLIKKREALLRPLAAALTAAVESIQSCGTCGNLDTADPCVICRDERRDPTIICVVEEVSDLWAIERSGAFGGRYHVLGGTLSALDGRGPEQLRVDALAARARAPEVSEVILALSATASGWPTPGSP
jgi:recombination protein RecR